MGLTSAAFTQNRQQMYKEAFAVSISEASVTANDVTIVTFSDMFTRRTHRSLAQVSYSALRVTSEIPVTNAQSANYVSTAIERSVQGGNFVSTLVSRGLTEVTHSGIVSLGFENTPIVLSNSENMYQDLYASNGTAVSRTPASAPDVGTTATTTSLDLLSYILGDSSSLSFSVAGLAVCTTWCGSECSSWPMNQCTTSANTGCECSLADEFIPIMVVIGIVLLLLIICMLYMCCCKKKARRR